MAPHNYPYAINAMAPSDRAIPSQLVADNFLLKINQATKAVSNTMPMLLMGIMAELLFAYPF